MVSGSGSSVPWCCPIDSFTGDEDVPQVSASWGTERAAEWGAGDAQLCTDGAISLYQGAGLQFGMQRRGLLSLMMASQVPTLLQWVAECVLNGHYPLSRELKMAFQLVPLPVSILDTAAARHCCCQ